MNIVIVLLIGLLFTQQEYKKEIEYVKEYAKQNGYNQEICFLVDFNKHCGKKRMYLVWMKKGVIDYNLSGLVAHGWGCGDDNDCTPSDFSNTPNSNCSSVGMSYIDGRDYSSYGLNYKYWLKGLDYTNNNMKKRIVVIHSYDGMSSEEIYPEELFRSQGCFTISNWHLEEYDKKIKQYEKYGKILLYAFK